MGPHYKQCFYRITMLLILSLFSLTTMSSTSKLCSFDLSKFPDKDFPSDLNILTWPPPLL